MRSKISSFQTAAKRWSAVLERDQTAANAFCYAIATTGIYCRPGCSSRLPQRRNVEFFDDCAAAESAGYRPCKRCRPNAESPRDSRVRLVVRACQRIEAAEEPPLLKELAAEAGLSPWHFHRIFKEVAGVTPKQYAAAHRDQRFRVGLGSAVTVTEAIYEAGFGSSSRAYQGASARLGMKPSAYRAGAAGEAIRFTIVPCSLGWAMIAATDRGICAIEFGDSQDDVRKRLDEVFHRASVDDGDEAFAAWVAAAVALIDAPEHTRDLPLDIQGTAFQRRVWEALRDVPAGSTVSYADLARRIGSRRAVRAVAGACAANRIAVAIPCHRAVRSDGGLGGYRWGIERKTALLDREKPGR